MATDRRRATGTRARSCGIAAGRTKLLQSRAGSYTAGAPADRSHAPEAAATGVRGLWVPRCHARSPFPGSPLRRRPRRALRPARRPRAPCTVSSPSRPPRSAAPGPAPGRPATHSPPPRRDPGVHQRELTMASLRSRVDRRDPRDRRRASSSSDGFPCSATSPGPPHGWSRARSGPDQRRAKASPNTRTQSRPDAAQLTRTRVVRRPGHPRRRPGRRA